MATHFVLQWARLGDLFQTRPLLTRIRARDPKANILLCVDEMYRSLTSTFPEVDRVIGIPLRHYWALAKTERNLDILFEEFHKLPHLSGVAKPDIAYVLNNSTAAAHFAKLLCPEETRGFFSSGDAHDPPMTYLDTMLADRNASPAHLADLWAALAGSPATNMEFPPDLPLSSQELTRRTLGIFVGAGNPVRAWPVESWCQFLSSLDRHRPDMSILLLGTENDIEQAKQIEEYCKHTHFHATNLAGKTELNTLGSFLKSCDLVVGTDTGGLHFAAALGVPVLGLYYSGARAAYTGPYAASACVLEGEYDNLAPPPEDAAHIATALLNGEDATRLTLATEIVLRHPVFDPYGLLYVNQKEQSEFSFNNREQLWRRVTFPYEKGKPKLSLIIPSVPSGEFALSICTDTSPLVTVVCAEDACTAGSRIRWAGPLARFEQEKLLRSSWHVPNDSNESWDYLEKKLAASALIILRRPLRTPQENYRLLEYIQLAKIPFIVDADDLVIERFSSRSVRGQARHEYEECFRELLEFANVVTVSTPGLAENMKRYSKNVHVLPNTIDSRWWPEAQNRVAKKDTFNIGFFGSPAHGLDLANIAEALKRFLDEEEGNARFYTWGVFPETLRTHTAIRQGGAFLHNYEVHLQRLACVSLHAAVVPLMDTPANRCRSVIRFLELGWYGIPAVYSRVGEFERHVTDKQNGLLIGETTDEWLNALRLLRHDTELRNTIAMEARFTVERHWTIEKHISNYLAVMSKVGIGPRSEFRKSTSKPLAVMEQANV